VVLAARKEALEIATNQ